jgi:hypothetical protein
VPPLPAPDLPAARWLASWTVSGEEVPRLSGVGKMTGDGSHGLRRWIALAVVVAVAVSGAVYVFARTTRWPASFCRPIVRVVGGDAVALTRLPITYPTVVNCVNVSSSSGSRQRCQTEPPPLPSGPTIASPVAADDLARLHRDTLLALNFAPTSRWRAELSQYVTQTVGSPRAFMFGGAMGNFDEFARTSLEACGIHPLGK